MLKNLGNSFLKCFPNYSRVRTIHQSSVFNAWPGKNLEKERCQHWKSYNDKMYPPQLPDEPRRPAYVCHCKPNLKYSYKKMWYIAKFIRGLSVEEALKQLQFVSKKGAVAITDAITEAQEMAVSDHNVEFKSNLWVSESFVGKSLVVKGLRRHAKMRMGEVRYGYIHYFVTLEEGTPPEHYYYYSRTRSGEELLAEWLQQMRERKISSSL